MRFPFRRRREANSDDLPTLIRALPEDHWQRVTFNGMSLLLPSYTMRLYTGCASGSLNDLHFIVEHAHSMRLLQQLAPGSLFLDIGASSGAMSIPFGFARSDIKIIAFEPARRARAVLEESITRNNLDNVTVLPYAISDTDGVSSFAEYAENVSCSFKPETSHLEGGLLLADEHLTYTVEVRKLDTIASTFPKFSRLVLKIDVESFEEYVLRGAATVIDKYRPFMAIDIHQSIDGPGDTELSVRRLLNGKYAFERIGHVLICSPSA